MKTSFAMLTLISGLALAGCGPKAPTGSDTSSSETPTANEGQSRDASMPATPATPAVTNLPVTPALTNAPVMPIETNQPDTNGSSDSPAPATNSTPAQQ